MESPLQSPARAKSVLFAFAFWAAADKAVVAAAISKTASKKSAVNRLIMERPLSLLLRLRGQTKVIGDRAGGAVALSGVRYNQNNHESIRHSHAEEHGS